MKREEKEWVQGFRTQQCNRGARIVKWAGGPHEPAQYVRLEEKRRVQKIIEEQVNDRQTPLFLSFFSW